MKSKRAQNYRIVRAFVVFFTVLSSLFVSCEVGDMILLGDKILSLNFRNRPIICADGVTGSGGSFPPSNPVAGAMVLVPVGNQFRKRFGQNYLLVI